MSGCRPERVEHLYKKLVELGKQMMDEGEPGKAVAYELSADMLLETFPIWLAKYLE